MASFDNPIHKQKALEMHNNILELKFTLNQD